MRDDDPDNTKAVEKQALSLIGGVEDWAKDTLNVLDMFANANLGIGLGLNTGRAGKVTGMSVGLQRPFHG